MRDNDIYRRSHERCCDSLAILRRGQAFAKGGEICRGGTVAESIQLGNEESPSTGRLARPVNQQESPASMLSRSRKQLSTGEWSEVPKTADLALR